MRARDKIAARPASAGASIEIRPAPPQSDGTGPGLPGRSASFPSGSMEFPVQYQQTRKFQPAQRQLNRNLIIGPGTSSEISSSYNLLRTQVMRSLQERNWNTVAITSPSKGAGSTLTAVNLAISIARSLSYTVLLAELNFVQPSFRELMGFDQQKGIIDHLLNDEPISSILINPGIDRLVLAPAGSAVTNSSELLASPKMAALVEEFKDRYERRIVLFDLPPVLALDDAMTFSRLVDCALIVVEEGVTRVDEVRRAIDHLRSTNILGVVLNRSIHSENMIKMAPR
jgi:protein-tyrosine kinase